MVLLRFSSIRFSRCVWVGALAAIIVLFGMQGVAVAQAQNTALTFNNGGFLQNIIKSGSTADFEMVMSRVKEGLQNSDSLFFKQKSVNFKALFESIEAEQAIRGTL